MAFIWDLIKRFPAPAPAPAAAPAPEPEEPVPDLPLSQAVTGLAGLEKIAFAARRAIATRGASLPDDAALTLAILDEAAALIPETAAIDQAAHVAATVIPFLIDLRRARPMNNPVEDAQTSHSQPNWR